MKSLLTGGRRSSSTVGATRYASVNSVHSQQSTESEVQVVVPCAGTIRNLHVVQGTACGAGQSIVYTLRLNGADSALAVTIGGASDTTGVDDADDIAVSAGDILSMQIVISASAAQTGSGWSMEFESTTANQYPVMGGATGFGAGTFYFPISGGSSERNATLATEAFPVSPAGTFRDFYVSLPVAPGVGKTRTLELWKNGASTGVTVTISDTATTGSDTTNTISVSAGDVFAVKHTDSGTPASSAVLYGVEFDPTTAGEFPLFSGDDDNINSLATTYLGIGNSTGGWVDSGSKYGCGQPMTVKKMYAELTVAPGSGKSVALSLNVNGSNSTLTTTIADAATTGNDTTHEVSVTDLQFLRLEEAPSGNPTTTKAHVGMTGVMAAAAVDPSVTDDVTITESVTMMVDESINVFDGVTVSEAVTMMMDLNIDVFDDVTVTESVALEIMGEDPVATDDITITESVTLLILEMVPSIFDDVTLTEAVTMEMSLDISVFDSVTVTESVAGEQINGFMSADDVTVSEDVQMMMDLNVSVFDAVTVTEPVTAIVAAAKDGLIRMRSSEQSYPLMMDDDENR